MRGRGGSLLLSFHTATLDIAVWASSHVEFLIAGQEAVLMTYAIAARSCYTRGPLTQPFLIC